MEKKWNQSRNIICFNPPFDKDVSANVARRFLNLIEQRLPKSDKLYENFNKNIVKTRCSSKQNISNIIKPHNKNIFNKDVKRIEAM